MSFPLCSTHWDRFHVFFSQSKSWKKLTIYQLIQIVYQIEEEASYGNAPVCTVDKVAAPPGTFHTFIIIKHDMYLQIFIYLSQHFVCDEFWKCECLKA